MSLLRTGFRATVLVLGGLGPLAAQDPIPVDSVLMLPELRVEVGRLRTGSVPITDVPFPVQIIGGSNLQGTTGSSVAQALTQAAGINHVFGAFGFPGLPHEKVMRSIELFATQVMPHFQEVPVA